MERAGQPDRTTLAALLARRAPTVAISIADGPERSQLAAALEAGADVVELRLDRCADRSPQAAAELARAVHAPTIATVRSSAEGGEWTGTDDDRVAVFDAVAAHVGGLDVELSSAAILDDVVGIARRHELVAVVSFHDFDATPDDQALLGVIESARAAGADVVKVSTTARSLDDVARLSRLTIEHSSDGVIVIAMGDLGAMSRVFFPALGSALTFAAWGAPGAPGQLDLREHVELQRRFYPSTS